MIDRIKNRLLKEKLQLVKIDKSGKILESENNIFKLPIGSSIYSVDPVFEAIRYYFEDTSDRDHYHLSCVNLSIGEKEGIFDVLVDVGETIALTIVDFTTHYNISNTISQERNESIVQAQILKERDEFKNQFLANTSHELRTPLSTIMGFATILKKSDLTLDQMHSVNIIKNASEQLKNMIDDILDISTIQLGNLKIENERFNFYNLIDHIKVTFTEKYSNKDLRFTIKKEKGIPRFLIGDKFRILQVLSNVIDNAFKFTELGRIGVSITQITRENDEALRFVIKDTGYGIPKDKVDHIFESFLRAHPDGSIIGTGLGLAIVKNLLNLMNGTIKVKSKEGRGSEFEIILPLRPSENQKLDKKPTQLVKQVAKGKLKKYSILIAEDIESNQLLLMKILINHKDFYFDIASSGDQVIELLHKNKYDLILMDLKMPTMDGYDTTHFIRQNSQSNFKDIPIIAVTAKVSALEKQKCLDYGMQDYIAKPFDEDEVIDKINKVLKE